MSGIKWSEFRENIQKEAGSTDLDQVVGLQDGENVRYYLPSSTKNIIDADKFNRNLDGSVNYNTETIQEAIDFIGTSACDLFLSKGNWTISDNIDLSNTNIHLILDDGAILTVEQPTLTFTFPRTFEITRKRHFYGSGNIRFALGCSEKILSEWWGTLPEDPDSDDTSALLAFEASIYESQIPEAYLSPGIYGFNGSTSASPVSFEIRTPMVAYGVTIKQLATERSTQPTVTVIGSNLGDLEYFYIKGLKIDSNYVRSGITLSNFNSSRRFLVEDLTAEYSNTYGIRAVNIAKEGKFVHCTSRFVKYNKADGDSPIVGGGADAFNAIGANNITWVGCYAYDFRRIGFTSEANGETKSYNSQYIDCIAEYAHDEEDSTNQINSGFWVENTNSANFTNCTCINIGSGVGQSRFTAGFVIGSGLSEQSSFNISNCKVIKNDAELARGINLAGDADNDFAVINVDNFYVEQCYQGIVIGDVAKVSLRNISTYKINYISQADNGCSVLVAESTLKELIIDNLQVEDNSISDSTGEITFYGPVVDCNYVLKNSFGITHAMANTAGSAKTVNVNNCSIIFGNSSRPTFTSVDSTTYNGCTFFERTGSNASLLTTNDTNKVIVESSTIQFDTWTQIGNNGQNGNLSLFGCEIRNGAIAINYTTGFINISDCTFTNFEGSRGAIWTNFNSPTDLKLLVDNSNFISTTTSAVPLKLRNNSPNRVILTNNKYNTTFLTDLSVTQAFNNINLTSPSLSRSNLIGRFVVNSTSTTFVDGVHTSAYHLQVVSNKGVLLTDSVTNSNNKFGRISIAHYTNSEEPVAIIQGSSQSGTTVIDIGGGNSDVNAATTVNILVAANTTTPTGTTVASFTSTAIQFTPTTSFASNVNITGKFCIGSTALNDVGMYLASTNLTGTSQYGTSVEPLFTSGATSNGIVNWARLRTAAASFTMTNGYGHLITSPSLGAGSSVTNLYGLYIENQSSGGTLNYAIYTNAGLVRFGDLLNLAASTTSRASLNIPSGTAPSSPNDGDIWNNGTNLFVRLGGVTYTINKT